MDGGCRTFRKRVYQRPGGFPGTTQVVCKYWQKGTCNRSPCKFLHSEAPQSTEMPAVRKRSNPSDDDRREKKRFTWTRNPTQGLPDSNAKTVQKEEPEPEKKLCQYWANGNCIQGENCSNLHSWFIGSGVNFLANLEGHKQAVTGVSLPSGSSKLFSGSKDGCLHVWDCSTGHRLFSDELGCEIGCIISVSPLLFVGLVNGVKVYNLDNQTAFHLGGPNGLVHCLTYDDVTQTLFGGVDDGSVLVWEATPESSQPVVVATYHGHEKAVLSVFIGKGKQIFSASEDSTIRVWDRDTSECLDVLNQHSASVTSLLCWESYMITGSLDNSVKLWGNVEDGTIQVVRQVEEDGESRVLALGGMYDKDCNPILLCARSDNTVRLLSLPNLTEICRIFTKAAVQTISVETISKESSRLFFTGYATGQVGVWRLPIEE